MLKGQGGITLVALVVTIIVLIILATVSIAIVSNSTSRKCGKNLWKYWYLL